MRMDDEPIYGDAREVREMARRQRMLRPYLVAIGALVAVLVVVLVAWLGG